MSQVGLLKKCRANTLLEVSPVAEFATRLVIITIGAMALLTVQVEAAAATNQLHLQRKKRRAVPLTWSLPVPRRKSTCLLPTSRRVIPAICRRDKKWNTRSLGLEKC